MDTLAMLCSARPAGADTKNPDSGPAMDAVLNRIPDARGLFSELFNVAASRPAKSPRVKC
jgi:hypothetical protein